MARGLIDGKQARKYAAWVGKSANTEIYNRFILENIRVGKNIKICDLCCGSGVTLELLGNRSGEITGVDASGEMIKICTEKFKNNSRINLVLSPAEKTGLGANYFDYVIIRMGLHHIREKETAMDEILRILRPGGKVVVIDKYYTNKQRYHFWEFLSALARFDISSFDQFVESKERNELSLSAKFCILKREYLPKKHAKQVFMFVLKKLSRKSSSHRADKTRKQKNAGNKRRD